MGNMRADCDEVTVVGIFVIPKLYFKVLND
jgi:hypothetical protein